MNIYQNITELIGKTPLVSLNNFCRFKEIDINLYAKIESFNPAGSAKDRIALSMINDAEAKGLLYPGSVIIEPTSGNTGIGLAMVAAVRGYRLILTMPETMSIERQKLLKAYGAEIVLTKGKDGMTGAVLKAEELMKENPGSFIPGQFTNMKNPEIHYHTTGPEIWKDTEGNVDIFVSGVGTGGTISGVGKFLKEKNSSVKIIAVEPSDSPLLSKGRAGSHGIQGIGANFIPETLDQQIYDEIFTVSLEDAYQTGRELAQTEGILVGISSAAAVFASVSVAKHPKNKGKNIVVLLPDTGERYLSTDMF